MNPALMNNRMVGGVPNLGYDMGQPVLANGQMPAPAALSGNARGSVRMPQMPQNQRINMGGEGLMRMGMAGMGASNQGPMAQFSAMGDMYGQMMDYNRARDMDEYAIQEAQALEQQRRLDLQRKMEQEQTKDNEPDVEGAAKALVNLQTAQDVLQGFDDFNDVVGWKSMFARKWDQMTDNKRENIRLKIETLKVDRVLANIAQTKGAISEREMDIFMSDQPSWVAGEEIWRNWINDYIAALRVMHTNLANGTTVNNGATMNTMSNSGAYKILSTEPEPNQ
ncbi:MAG: hypothetical protein CMA71_00805 [Euryarchaeota archaeon]|jgi:hypothetical protein|nr:hypothetical protein [Euryarchaeota archaeon]|tara:strand:+ start:492 stop:1331 length:840 start_codon:yes stop_codon:yes gene_type:complete